MYNNLAIGCIGVLFLIGVTYAQKGVSSETLQLLLLLDVPRSAVKFGLSDIRSK